MSRRKQVYDFLLEGILSNRYQPGYPIVEQEISNELGVSRTPIREALKALEAEGLVNHYPSRGTFVTPITPYDVEEIFNLRIMLELSALQLAWDKITDDELEQIEKKFSLLNENSSNEAHYKADKSIHALIVDKAGNRRLKQFLNILASQIERFRRIAAVRPSRLSNAKGEHLAILQALKNHDLKACEENLKVHLENAKKSTLELARVITAKENDWK